MKKQFTGNVTMQYHINERAYHDVEFRMWKNYGKKRIYFESKAIKGYIDCNNNNEIVITKKSYSNAKKVIEDFINTYDF